MPVISFRQLSDHPFAPSMPFALAEYCSDWVAAVERSSVRPADFVAAADYECLARLSDCSARHYHAYFVALDSAFVLVVVAFVAEYVEVGLGAVVASAEADHGTAVGRAADEPDIVVETGIAADAALALDTVAVAPDIVAAAVSGPDNVAVARSELLDGVVVAVSDPDTAAAVRGRPSVAAALSAPDTVAETDAPVADDTARIVVGVAAGTAAQRSRERVKKRQFRVRRRT